MNKADLLDFININIPDDSDIQMTFEISAPPVESTALIGTTFGSAAYMIRSDRIRRQGGINIVFNTH